MRCLRRSVALCTAHRILQPAPPGCSCEEQAYGGQGTEVQTTVQYCAFGPIAINSTIAPQQLRLEGRLNMRRNATLFACILLSAAVMVAVPVGIFLFGSADSGMALAIIFLFLIAPAWSLIAGIFAGRDLRRLWPLPLISAALFLCGMWLGTASFSTDFFLYAVVYLCLSGIALLLTWLIVGRRRTENAKVL